MHSKEILQECGINIKLQTIKDSMSILFCKPSNDQHFLFNACVSSTCDMCGNLSLLDQCLHENSLTTLGQQLFDVKRFKLLDIH